MTNLELSNLVKLCLFILSNIVSSFSGGNRYNKGGNSLMENYYFCHMEKIIFHVEIFFSRHFFGANNNKEKNLHGKKNEVEILRNNKGLPWVWPGQ